MKFFLLMMLFYLCNSYKYFYGSINRQYIKKKFNIYGLVEDHHIIPKQFKNHHKLKKYNFNISQSSNIMLMPNKIGIQNLDTNRMLHTGGHTQYNRYVGKMLENIDNEDDIKKIIWYLRYCIRNNNNKNIIPIAWK